MIVRQPYEKSFSFENDPIEVEAPVELKKYYTKDNLETKLRTTLEWQLAQMHSELTFKVERILE